MQPTAYQLRGLEIPEEINPAFLTGRAVGKSTLMAFLALRHGEQYGSRARMVLVRRSYPGLRDFEAIAREVFHKAYGDAFRYSSNDHVFKLPGGGFLELGQVDSASDLMKFQGRSLTLLLVDEIGQYPDLSLLETLRGNLRAPQGVKVRTVYAANPGGPAQATLAKRFIVGRKPWVPFRDEHGAWWQWCDGVLDDNPTIDRDAYRRQLREACAHDPELLRAWLEGSFMSAVGSYFGHVLDESRNAVGPFEVGKFPASHGEKWRHWVGMDHGSGAPAVAYLCAESPGAEFAGKYYPRGSIVALDEYATYRPGDLSKGLDMTARQTGEGIAAMCELWGVRPSVYADDQIFAVNTGHSISLPQEYSAAGLRMTPAKKGRRVPGWQAMKRMLADAGKLDTAGLYVSRACQYFWLTVPFLPRSLKDPEDVSTDGPDHAADAMRYSVLRGEPPPDPDSLRFMALGGYGLSRI